MMNPEALRSFTAGSCTRTRRGVIAPQEKCRMSQPKHALMVGEQLPDLTLTGIDGTSVRLADYRGKRLFIFMWASW